MKGQVDLVVLLHVGRLPGSPEVHEARYAVIYPERIRRKEGVGREILMRNGVMYGGILFRASLCLQKQ